MNNSKKIILFIVEGNNDKICLGYFLEKVINNANDDVQVIVTGGDITSDFQLQGTVDLYKKLKSFVVSFIKNKKISASDISRIIHLIDTDGAFISDNLILHHNEDNIKYSLDNIYTKDVKNTIKRNKQKTNYVNHLLFETQSIKIGKNNSIPYIIYFASCNLDHVLHNHISLSKKDKNSFANNFRKKYYENVNGFLEFLCDNDFSLSLSFNKSWDFIKSETNSLKRYTNFNLFLLEYRK